MHTKISQRITDYREPISLILKIIAFITFSTSVIYYASSTNESPHRILGALAFGFAMITMAMIIE